MIANRAVVGLADESVDAIKALAENKLGQHFSDRAKALKSYTSEIQGTSKAIVEGFGKQLRSEPKDAANQLFFTILGFYAGSGGDGDGGIPDLDLMLGIGAHRSILTHSIIAGAFIETLVFSFLDLSRVLHQHLPDSHSTFWDRLIEIQQTGSEFFVTGASVGIATHLGVDTLVDGFTPYKDLPISLPMGAHEALLGLNAVAEGTYGLKKAKEQLSQYSEPFPPENHVQPGLIDRTETSTTGSVKETRSRRAMMETNSHFRDQDAKDVFEESITKCRGALSDLKIAGEGFDKTCDECKEKIDNAGSPFRLGVIGEFRAGKSTLINALLGDEVAFVDILEATPVECVFRAGEKAEAILHSPEGGTTSVSIENANQQIFELRDDEAWNKSLDFIEYKLPSSRLGNFDLWDAPGMGGSDGNQAIADSFLDKLGAAIWVFDATLLGKATIAEPLRKLREDGKPVHAVINRIDEFSDSIQEAIELLGKLYPDNFESIHAISALASCEITSAGQKDNDLEAIWSSICKSVGLKESEGREMRIRRATESALKDIGRSITSIRHEAQDKIGLINHVAENLAASKARLMDQLESVLNEEVEKIFLQVKADLAGHINRLGSSEDAAEKIIGFFNDPRNHDRITGEIFSRAAVVLNEKWSSYSNHAIDLSRAALPAVFEKQQLATRSVEGEFVKREIGRGESVPTDMMAMIKNLFHGSNLSDESIEEGVYAAGMSFVIGGALAATSAVTWPVILVALPIGSLVAWKKSLESPTARKSPFEVLQESMNQMHAGFIERALPEIATDLERQVDASIDLVLQAHCLEMLGSKKLDEALRARETLYALEKVLIGNDFEDKNEFLGSELIQLLKNPGSRLDLFIPEMGFSLAPLLEVLPPDTRLRLVVTGNVDDFDDLKQQVKMAFGDWQGVYSVYCVQLANGESIPISELILISTDIAVTGPGLESFYTDQAIYSLFSDGRVAAQKMFAELWEGQSARYGDLKRRSIY
ncbi:GTPase domain-containing protein [Pseudomonadota bacterium]